jgi:hypothetical protein
MVVPKRATKPRRRWLFWSAGLLLLSLIAAGALLIEMTSPPRVRAQLIAWLENQLNQEFDVGDVRLDWSGLVTIDWLHLGSREALTQPSESSMAFARFRGISVHLAADELLLGKIIPQSIDAENAEILIPEQSASDDSTNPPIDAAAITTILKSLAHDLDFPVHLNQCEIGLLAKHRKRPQLYQRWSFNLRAIPTSERQPLRIIARTPNQAGDTTITVHTSGAAIINVDQILLSNLNALLALIPSAQSIQAKLSQCRLNGQLQVNATRTPSGAFEFVGSLSRGELLLPIETPPVDQPYAQLTNISGSIVLSADTCELNIGAKLDHCDLHLVTAFTSQAATDTPLERWPAPDEWTGTVHLTAQTLDVPTHERNPHFVNSTHLPQRVRTLLDEFLPEGTINVDLQAARTRTNDPTANPQWSYTAKIDTIDARCKYHRFPYNIDRIDGGLDIVDDRITFRDFIGHYGNARIFASGVVFNSAPWTGFDLHFRGIGLPLNQDLYEAIPKSQQKLWDDAQLAGRIDVDLTMSRPNGTRESGPQAADSHMAATLHNADLAFTDTTLYDADVFLIARDGRVQIKALDALSDTATLAIIGTSNLDPNRPPREQWSILAENHTLTMTAAVGDMLAGSGRTATGSAAIPPITANLVVDAIGDLQIDDQHKGRRFAATIKDGSLQFFDPARSFDISGGSVLVNDDDLRLVDLHCSSTCGEIKLSGPVEARDAADPLRVELRSRPENDSINTLLDSVVPPAWRDSAGAFELRGSTDISAEFLVVEDDLHVRLEIIAGSARPRIFPLMLKDVSAQLTLKPDGFILREAHGSYDQNGKISVSGRGEWAEPTPITELTIDAQNVPLDKAFINAFPKTFAESIQRLTPRGTIAAANQGIQITTNRDGGWQVGGTLNYDGPEIDLGLKLTDFKASIAGQCRVAVNGKLHVAADITIDHGQLAGRPMATCKATLLNEPNSPWIHIREILGKFCGGEVRGSVDVEPAGAAYRAELALRNLNFDQFVGGTSPDAPQTNARVEGRIYVEGVADRVATRIGRGELRLTAPPIDRTPVLSSVASASKKTRHKLPANADELILRFDWRGATLILNHIEIDGSPLRLVGKGQWNMATDAIDLTLISAPLKLPASPLRDLLEIAGEELVQYRVTGTADDPKVTLEPLHNMTSAVRELLEAFIRPGRE